LFGKAAFAAGASLLAAAVAAWITDFNPAAWAPEAALAKTTAALSFDDRFGSRSTLSSASIYYPSHRGVRSDRGDFNAEFGHIEGALFGQGREGQADQPAQSEQSQTSAVASIPLPRSRPAEANLLQARNDPPLPPPVQGDNRTILQKLADLMPARLTFASLEPNGGILSGSGPDLAALGYDGTTAVYDISARAVYMPDRTQLEAHSGLGGLMDDPSHVDARNAGATPPGTYEMKARERLFHGVPAIRMLPVDGSDTLGRTGLLVHSYMLGPNGDSNGCVSIKSYDRFLKAFRSGEIKRLVVVTDLKRLQMASSQPRS
jgi:hypothetical protein